MEIVLYFILSWLTIMVFILMKKELSPVENAFLFFVTSIFIKNSFSIAAVNLKWIEPSSDKILFTAYLSYRTIIFPVMLLIFTNILYKKLPLQIKSVLSMLTLLFILIIENVGKHLQLYQYVKWNNLYNVIEIALFAIISFGMAKWFMRINRKEFTNESLR